MKKYLSIIGQIPLKAGLSFFLFCFSSVAWTQVSAGPKLLLNFSNAIGGENSAGNKFKLGFSAGVFLKLEISDQISLQPEMLYSTRGFKYQSSVSGRDTSLKHNLSYIDFPFLLSIRIAENGFINFGPQIGYLMNDKITGVVSSSSSSESVETSNVYGYNTTEYALVLGGGYRFPFKLLVAVQGVYGITKLYANGDLSHNFTFGLSVAYSFGDSVGGTGQGLIYRNL